MAVQRKGFAAPDDPILIKTAQEIPVKEISSLKTKKIIEKMLKFAYPEQSDRKKPVLVGLAAPQVKISKRIILVDVMADGHGKVGDLRVYINPEIVWKSKQEAEWYEGCFSTDRVCGVVSRPAKIKIRAYTPEGKLVKESHEGYIARIFQHEIDHLNGKEFVTHITDDEKLHWVKDGQFPQYRDKEAWRTWPTKCPRERWEKIKGIRNTSSKMVERLLQEFKKLNKETKNIIDGFPPKKREEILFGEWSLKDVVAHFNHWAIHDLTCFKALKEGREPYWAPDIDEYNKEGVRARKNKPWEDVCNEFNSLFNEVISGYETLPGDLWNKKFWKNRKFTPLKFLKIDIDHYKNEHLPQLRKYIK